METIARHYTSPATPPKLVVQLNGAVSSGPAPTAICLRCGGNIGHAAIRLVTFGWGRVAPSNLRR